MLLRPDDSNSTPIARCASYAAAILHGAPLVAAVLLQGCSTSEDVRELIPVLNPHFPDAASLDYEPHVAMAHAALPLFNRKTDRFEGSSRIWVKGSIAAATVQVGSDEPVSLHPPHYTAVLTAAPGRQRVQFEGLDDYEVVVVAPSADDLNGRSDSTSLLAYGCFDPFDVTRDSVFVSPGDGTGKPGIKNGHFARFVEIRRLFRAVALGELPGSSRAALVLGAGDQVYVEPAHDRYSELGMHHPLSAWTIEKNPRPRLALSPFTEFLSRTYRASWSFEPLRDVFQQVPTVLMWDDHEIRDGWGSHSDEHVYVDTYYAAARTAFIEHQFHRGPTEWTVEHDLPGSSLHQELQVNGIPIFVMDQRSARDIHVPQVLGDAQTRAFRQWLDEIVPSSQPYCVIVSPLPMLYRVSGLLELAAQFGDESWDDILDSWSSDANVEELDLLTLALIDAFERGVRPIIISGDMHASALLRAEYKRPGSGKFATFAHEIVASGLASVVDGSSLKYRLAKRGSLTSGSIELGDAMMKVELGTSNSVPNFAGLEFVDGVSIAHLYQADKGELLHYRVPLEWGAEVSSLEERMSGGSIKIEWGQ